MGLGTARNGPFDPGSDEPDVVDLKLDQESADNWSIVKALETAENWQWKAADGEYNWITANRLSGVSLRDNRRRLWRRGNSSPRDNER